MAPSCGKSEESEESAKMNQVSAKSRADAAAGKIANQLGRELAAAGLTAGQPVFIRAFKREKVLEFYIFHPEKKIYQLFKSYEIAGMSGVLGPKLAEGDLQVPEGFYHVGPSAMNPQSKFHLAFNIGFPNAYERGHGWTGSFIMIHGDTASIGCLAMTDPVIEEIYSLCVAAHRGGQGFFRVHIFPFRMDEASMAEQVDHRWAGFWENLQEGYAWFEREKLPPEVGVAEGRYTFQRD